MDEHPFDDVFEGLGQVFLEVGWAWLGPALGMGGDKEFKSRLSEG